MSSRSILIVDDDAAVLESLHDELSPVFDVTCVGGGEAALAALKKQRFDLLLSDVRMPGIDGVDLVRQAKSIDPEMMRVLLTGYADEDARLASRARDGVFKLNKPWKDELESVLLRALEHRERVRRMADMVGNLDRLAGLGRMLMSIVHDMSSPLSYVQANVNTLARDLAASGSVTTSMGADDVNELLHDVREGVRRIVELVQRIRAYGNPTSSEPRAVGLRSVVESALKVTQSQLRHRIAVDVRGTDEDALVMTPGRDVEQIVVNLLLNAAQSMDWKGAVTVELGARDGWAKLSVTDQGPGLSVERLESIFDPFHVGTSPAEKDGIALAVSSEIAQRCGGRLDVKSELGCGSTFTLELPRVAVA